MLNKVMKGDLNVTEKTMLIKVSLMIVVKLIVLFVLIGQFTKFLNFRWEMTVQDLRNKAVQECMNLSVLRMENDDEATLKLDDSIYNKCMSDKGYN